MSIVVVLRPGQSGNDVYLRPDRSAVIDVYLRPGAPNPTDVYLRREGRPYDVDAGAAPPAFPTQFAGLKCWDGTAAIDLCLVAAADYNPGMGAALMIKGTAATYAVYLVETTDPDASPKRIPTSAGTKAVRLKT